ncbi:MAG: hypothetical protein A4E67_02509 [Syntrophaceae bacterium PtaB.Bin038]|nr:MAG: hypothetical protein A4E67_02509 [Syntrophaceae bacterium PtaB.Bin038]
MRVPRPVFGHHGQGRQAPEAQGSLPDERRPRGGHRPLEAARRLRRKHPPIFPSVQDRLRQDPAAREKGAQGRHPPVLRGHGRGLAGSPLAPAPCHQGPGDNPGAGQAREGRGQRPHERREEQHPRRDHPVLPVPLPQGGTGRLRPGHPSPGHPQHSLLRAGGREPAQGDRPGFHGGEVHEPHRRRDAPLPGDPHPEALQFLPPDLRLLPAQLGDQGHGRHRHDGPQEGQRGPALDR